MTFDESLAKIEFCIMEAGLFGVLLFTYFCVAFVALLLNFQAENRNYFKCGNFRKITYMMSRCLDILKGFECFCENNRYRS